MPSDEHNTVSERRYSTRQISEWCRRLHTRRRNRHRYSDHSGRRKCKRMRRVDLIMLRDRFETGRCMLPCLDHYLSLLFSTLYPFPFRCLGAVPSDSKELRIPCSFRLGISPRAKPISFVREPQRQNQGGIINNAMPPSPKKTPKTTPCLFLTHLPIPSHHPPQT